METITQIISGADVEKLMKSSRNASLPVSQTPHRPRETWPTPTQQNSTAYLAQFNSPDEFLATYNPDLQYRLAPYPERCFTGKAPTLAAVKTTYGVEIAISWLEAQLHDLAEYAGAKDKLTAAQSVVAANTILSSYYYLNVAEIMLFFFKFKAGKYGKFYGAVDPLTITTALCKFCDERRDALFKIESDKAAAERAKPRTGCVNLDEYLAIKARAEKGDAEAVKLLTPPTNE